MKNSNINFKTWSTKIKINTFKSLLAFFIIQVLIIICMFINANGILYLIKFILLFTYITFIPGYTIIKIIKFNKINLTDLLIFSLGISLATVATIGVLVNIIFIFFGITPFNKLLITLTFIFIITILYLISEYRCRVLEIEISFSYTVPQLLAIVLLLLLGLLGIFLLRISNSIFLIYLLFITLLPFTVNKLNKNIYQIALLAVTLPLVLFSPLFGQYMRPTDNITELFFVQQVLSNGFWDYSNPSGYNSLLAVTIVIPIYCLMLDLHQIYFYKYIVPILSIFIPFTLYKSYNCYFNNNDKISFLSVLFFVTMFNFFAWSANTMKMVSSGIYLSLIVYLITTREIDLIRKKILLLLFLWGVVISHYGTAYLLLMVFILSKCLQLFLRKHIIRSYNIIDIYLILYFMSLTIFWYLIFRRTFSFEQFLYILANIISTRIVILKGKTYGTKLLTEMIAPYIEIIKLLYIFIYLLMLIGILYMFFTKLKEKAIDEYILMSLIFTFIIPLPYISDIGLYSGGRAWLLPSFFAIPFVTVGGIQIYNQFVKKITITKYFNNISTSSFRDSYFFIAVFLCLFIAFNTGLAAEVFWKHNISPTAYVGGSRILQNGTIDEKEYFYKIYLTEKDLEASRWVTNKMDYKNIILCGANSEKYFQLLGLASEYSYKRMGKTKESIKVFKLTNNTRVIHNSYVYLSEFNLATKKIKIIPKSDPVWGTFTFHFDISEIHDILISSNKIYTNGGSEIYLKV